MCAPACELEIDMDNATDCRAHEEMGFHQGWGESLDRLVEVVTQRMPD